MKLLNMAGIDADSEVAEEVLAAGKVSADVIKGVRDIARKQKQFVAGSAKGGGIDSNLNASTEEGASLVRQEGDSISPKELRALEKASDLDSVCICQRCFRLQQYGQVQESLRPGWSEHELLSPERFQSLLQSAFQRHW